MMKTPFEEIYEAVKNNDVSQLRLLKLKCSSLDFCTSVTRIAKEGDPLCFKLLLSEEETKNWALKGAAQGGHFESIKELIQQGTGKDWAVNGAALGGHFEFVRELIQQGAGIDKAVHGAATGGHFKFVQELIQQGADINWAIQGTIQGGHFDDIENALYTLANIEDSDFGKKLALGVAKQKKFAFSMEELLKAANKIKNLMQDRQLSYQEVKSWLGSKDLRNLFLYAYSLSKKLPVELYLYIASFLVTSRLDSNELRSLCTTQRFNVILKKPLLVDIESYLSYASGDDKNTATEFKAALTRTTKPAEIQEKLINEQMKKPNSVVLNQQGGENTWSKVKKSFDWFFSTKHKAYSEIIEQHLERCQKFN